MKQETLKDKKFQQKLVDKLNNGELSYQNAPIYTILLDLVQGNSVDEVYRVFCEVIKEQNNNKYSEEEIRNIAEASFSFYRTNEFSDDELEVEWRNWLEKRIELLKKK